MKKLLDDPKDIIYRLHYGSDYFNANKTCDVSERRLQELREQGRLDDNYFYAITAESYESGEIRIFHEPYCPYFITLL